MSSYENDFKPPIWRKINESRYQTVYAHKSRKNYEVDQKVNVFTFRSLLKIGERVPNALNILLNVTFQSILIEIQRLCPVVPLGVPHGILDDINIDGDYTISKDTMILVSHWNLNHDPENFPDPHLFVPDRFLIEENGSLYVKKGISPMPFQVKGMNRNIDSC